ncbi:hypothetical protein ABTW96_24295 [Nocardia beijingensis]|uniref:hypothetical protein n=1 Tax=Nocardia beijingensis TaxID=95162 RepID=UPI00332F0815
MPNGTDLTATDSVLDDRVRVILNARGVVASTRIEFASDDGASALAAAAARNVQAILVMKSGEAGAGSRAQRPGSQEPTRWGSETVLSAAAQDCSFR